MAASIAGQPYLFDKDLSAGKYKFLIEGIELLYPNHERLQAPQHCFHSNVLLPAAINALFDSLDI